MKYYTSRPGGKLICLLFVENEEPKRSKLGKFGKDPTVETGFLPDRYALCSFLLPCNEISKLSQLTYEIYENGG